VASSGLEGIRLAYLHLISRIYVPLPWENAPLLLYFIIILNMVVVLYSNLKMEEKITVKKYPVGCGF
jgi:hypothetical protein